MIVRLALLVGVSFLGALAFGTRRTDEPGALCKNAAKQTLQVLLWTAAGFVVMHLSERLWLDD